MGQVTIYLDEDSESKMSAAAEAMQMSKSKWVATLIQEKLATQWPVSVAQLSGAWHDFPELTTLRKNAVNDSPREPL